MNLLAVYVCTVYIYIYIATGYEGQPFKEHPETLLMAPNVRRP